MTAGHSTNWFTNLFDQIGERLYRAEYKRRMRPTKADRARSRAILEAIEKRADDKRRAAAHFDVDEDHCVCPNVCEVHP